MWVFTPWGFFSAVRKPGEADLTLCARVRGELETLRSRALPELGPVSEHADTDYPFRAHVAPAAWGSALAELAAQIDYPHFEDAVYAQQGGARAEVYLRVWHALHGLQTGQAGLYASSAAPPPSVPGPVPVARLIPSERVREAPAQSLRRAYGGVVVDGEGRLLLRERSGPDGVAAWSFAEGLTMAGERDIDAARRAVLEQTGLRCAIVSAIPGWFVGDTTASRFFLMSPLADAGRGEGEAVREPARVCWASFAESAELVARAPSAKGRERDLSVLREAEKVWRIGAR